MHLYHIDRSFPFKTLEAIHSSEPTGRKKSRQWDSQVQAWEDISNTQCFI